MDIDKILYSGEYKGPLKAYIDWIAGGNFDGYIYRLSLNFEEKANKVIQKFTIIDDAHYDDEISSSSHEGTFYYEKDHETINCVFEHFEMRGSILGEQNQYIAFTVSPKNKEFNSWDDCYELTLP